MTQSETSFLHYSGTEHGYTYFQIKREQIWASPNRDGEMIQYLGSPIFLGQADKTAWIADGRPAIPTGTSASALGPDPLYSISPICRPIPSPSASGSRGRSIESGPPGPAEDFVQVGDLLRETDASPAVTSGAVRLRRDHPWCCRSRCRQRSQRAIWHRPRLCQRRPAHRSDIRPDNQRAPRRGRDDRGGVIAQLSGGHVLRLDRVPRLECRRFDAFDRFNTRATTAGGNDWCARPEGLSRGHEDMARRERRRYAKPACPGFMGVDAARTGRTTRHTLSSQPDCHQRGVPGSP